MDFFDDVSVRHGNSTHPDIYHLCGPYSYTITVDGVTIPDATIPWFTYTPAVNDYSQGGYVPGKISILTNIADGDLYENYNPNYYDVVFTGTLDNYPSRSFTLNIQVEIVPCQVTSYTNTGIDGSVTASIQYTIGGGQATFYSPESWVQSPACGYNKYYRLCDYVDCSTAAVPCYPDACKSDFDAAYGGYMDHS